VTQGSNTVSESTTSESSITLDGLTNGVKYRIVVSAKNTVGSGGPSEHAYVTPATVPDPPGAITALRQNQGADVSWDAPLDDGGDPITGYQIQVRAGNEPPKSFITAESPYSIRGLKNGTTYGVSVSAINSVGNSVASESALVTPATVPDPPGSITALRQNQGADVAWDAPLDNGGDPITSYRLQVRHGNELPTTFITSESPYSIRGLENGITYSVTVSAINSVGDSVASESALVTPATVPDPPTSLNATAADGAAELEWTASSNSGGDPINGYRIRIWRDTVVISEFDTPITSASVPGLTNGVDYRVAVTAVNTVGESVAGESVTVTPFSPAVVEPPVIDPPVVEPPLVEPPVVEPPVVDPPVVEPPVMEPPIVDPPVVEPPVEDPPVASPPTVGPPIVDPPIVDTPPAVRNPSPPVDVAVIGATRKYISLGWRVGDSGGAPVIDFIVHTSRHKNRGFTVWPDSNSATPRVELRKPRRGGVYVRVITVTVRGESAPSQATWVARPKKLANTEDGGRALE